MGADRSGGTRPLPRNPEPLAHELGGDKITGARPVGLDEPATRKWHLTHKMTADELDGAETWPADWPILFKGRSASGSPRYELSSAALYWAVKQMVRTFAGDRERLASAVA
jgi:hypothetical protein